MCKIFDRSSLFKENISKSLDEFPETEFQPLSIKMVGELLFIK